MGWVHLLHLLVRCFSCDWLSPGVHILLGEEDAGVCPVGLLSL